jgi:hypothetical protein
MSNTTRIKSDFIALLEFEIARIEVYYRGARRRPAVATGRGGAMAGLAV